MNKKWHHDLMVHRWEFVCTCLILFTLLYLLSGCALWKPKTATPTTTVNVPIPVQSEPPPEIVQKFVPPAEPEWVSPSDPRASSCLTTQGEDEIKANEIIEQYLRKVTRAWATGEVL